MEEEKTATQYYIDYMEWLRDKKRDETEDIIYTINTGDYNFFYDWRTNSMRDRKSGKKIYSLEDFLKLWNGEKEKGKNLKRIYYDRDNNIDIRECRDCGTVSFVDTAFSDQENFRCPVCSKSSTSNEYWTKEDIRDDETKYRKVNHYRKLGKEEKRIARYFDENGTDKGLTDVSFPHQIKLKDHYLRFQLKCFDASKSKTNGLHLRISYGRYIDEDGEIFMISHKINIPLSWSHFNTYVLSNFKTFDMKECG